MEDEGSQKINHEAAARVLGGMMYDTVGQFLSPSERQNHVAGWTDLAKKYSQPRGIFNGVNHLPLSNTEKSGLTPLSSETSNIKKVESKRNKLEAYQRSRLHGFTAHELHRFEALAALDCSVMNHGLRNPIHNVFEKKQWFTKSEMPRHRGAIPILGGEDGFWLAENPMVWKILEPCLQLGSLVLANEHRYLWMDALFYGRYEDMANAPGDTHLERFYCCSQVERVTDPKMQEIQQKFRDMTQNLRLALCSGYEDPSSGLPALRVNRNAITKNNLVHKRVEILLAIELLQPLLRDDLTDAEKMAMRFKIATTLAHEFAHACRRTIIDSLQDGAAKNSIEPYFEDEPLSELGYSFMDKVWNGHPESIMRQAYNRGGPGLPNMGIFKTNWFTASHSGYQTARCPPQNKPLPSESREIDPFYTYDYWAVPTYWCSSLFRDEFWDVKVRKFGADATKMGPLEYGTRTVIGDPRRIETMGRLEKRDYESGVYEGMFEDTAIGEGWTDGEKEEALRRNSMAVRSRQIFDAMTTKSFSDLGDEEENLQMELGNSPLMPEYSCPRYKEIVEYLSASGGPLELALDTMGVLSEPAFYRYIRDREDISLTPMEFRGFLGAANERRELFIHEQFPGSGVVMRINAGWPKIQTYPLPSPFSQADQELMGFLDNLMTDPAVREELYKYFGEGRDLDIETFQKWLMYRGNDEFEIPLEDFKDVVYEMVREGVDYFTLGPDGIVRFIFEVDGLREGFADGFTKERMREFEGKRKDGDIQ